MVAQRRNDNLRLARGLENRLPFWGRDLLTVDRKLKHANCLAMFRASLTVCDSNQRADHSGSSLANSLAIVESLADLNASSVRMAAIVGSTIRAGGIALEVAL